MFLDELLLDDYNIRVYIEDYCLLRLEEFTFLIMNFVQFCVSQMTDVIKSAQFITSNKIKKEIMDKVKVFILDSFQNYKLKSDIITNFEASWNENCNLFIYPKNNVDNIGGQPRIIKMINGVILDSIPTPTPSTIPTSTPTPTPNFQVTALLEKDLITKYSQSSDYNLILAVTSLLND